MNIVRLAAYLRVALLLPILLQSLTTWLSADGYLGRAGFR
jgi:hypothetical protein